MSERAQKARVDGDDLLEQIITQGLDKLNAPAQAEAAGEAPPDEMPPALPQADSGTAANRSRRTAVYLYLLVLFGAAFLMLLLAYFIQRRSNEDTISDLRNSMNLSRKELLDQISALEEENTALKNQNAALGTEIDRLNSDLSQWQERHDEQVMDANVLLGQVLSGQTALNSWELFWELERFYQAGDYEACAAILILRDQEIYSYSTPDAALERDDEIVQTVIDAGYLKGDFHLHPEDYWELVDAFMSRRYFISRPDTSNHVSRETSSAQIS